MYSFRNGLQTLTDTLLTRIKQKGVDVRIEKSCTKLTFQDGKAMVSVRIFLIYQEVQLPQVEVNGEDNEEFSNVVSTISSQGTQYNNQFS